MELGEQYFINLKIICCSKRWKDLLLRNKFEETFVLLVCLCVFFFFADIFVFISNPLSNCSRLWEVA